MRWTPVPIDSRANRERRRYEKPRIRRMVYRKTTQWVCACNDFSGRGKTPLDAYAAWMHDRDKIR